MADPHLVHAVPDDLHTEGEDPDALIGGLDAGRRATAAPAQGWTLAHRTARLTRTGHRALPAVPEPDRFTADGADARRWLTLTQVFAGPAGAGLRPAGSPA